MDKHYNISDVTRRIGRSASTVRRWERDGVLKSKSLPSGHRDVDEEDVRAMLGKSHEKRLIVVDCRVSSHGQKDDLQSPIAAIQQHCLSAGAALDEWEQGVGVGMNFKRKQFLTLLDRTAARDISRRIVAHKDRLVRLGLGLFEHMAKCSDCVIEAVNQESLSTQEEMTEDLLSIVHTRSCLLHGMTKYRRKNDCDGLSA